MLGENTEGRSGTTEIRPSREDIENLYNGYKDLIDNHGGSGDKIKGVGALLSFGLEKIKISTKITIEGKSILLVVSQLRTKKSKKGSIIIGIDTGKNDGELVYLELSEKHVRWMYPERSLLDEALGKVLGRNVPTKKDLNIYFNALDIAKEQFAESSRNNSNKV